MAEINVYGPIGKSVTDTDGITAGMFSNVLAKHGGENLRVFVNSPGGNVLEGLTMYQMLVDWEGEVDIVIQGVAASIASVIAMAGDAITMAQSSRVMIHDPLGPSAMAFGTANDLREAAADTIKTAETLDSIRDTMADIYAARVKASREDILVWMAEETIFTAAEAHRVGFADTVKPNKSLAAASHPVGAIAYAMKDEDELQATLKLCEGITVRNRRKPSAELLRLRKAQQALTTF